jgi:uncharacterized protein (DUF2336 family)
LTNVAGWIERLRALWGGAYSSDARNGGASAGDPAGRRALAGGADAAPEVLSRLARDPAAEVRRALAGNPAAPPDADRALARDDDDDVRFALAAKIARLAAGLNGRERDAVRQKALDVLETLVRDQTARVRKIIAETLKDVAHAPPDVIRRLARDAEAAVSCPVLEYSPILSDQDLLEIIAGNPISGQLAAISRRKGVAAPVADAVVGSGDEAAIGALLGNPDAVIREATLDYLIDQAPSHESWHRPLVCRPGLPAKAAARLARFVAEGLLGALADRRDLPPDALAQVRRAVEKRLGGEPRHGGALEDAMRSAREHQEAGRLDEPMIAGAVRAGDREFVIAALTVRSRIPLEAIQKAVAEHDARAMLAVAWLAGLSATLAESLQLRLAAIAPGEVIRAAGGDYAMNADALAWQVEFMKNSA